MQIEQADFDRLPEHLKALFVKDSNPGRDEVLAGFPETKSNSGNLTHKAGVQGVAFGKYGGCATSGISDAGSAARFFYCAKASRADRNSGCEGLPEHRTGAMSATADGSMLTGSGNERTTTRANTHPTVKPEALMRYLTRLVTPLGGRVLDPFAGSGSTGKAAIAEGFYPVLCEMTDEYLPILQARIDHAVKLRYDKP